MNVGYQFHRLMYEILSCFSRLVNVLLGSSASLTFSARSHRDGLNSEKWIDRFFLLFGERNHCQLCWEYEVERSRRILLHDLERTEQPWNIK